MQNLKKFVGQEVSVVTLAHTAYRSWPEKNGEVTVQQKENIEDNLIQGIVRDASSDGLTVELDYRGRTFNYEINKSAIAWIMTSTLNDSGKAQSERMKAHHADGKK